MGYRRVVDSGQYDEPPSYDANELQRAVDSLNDWVRAQLGRYAGHVEEPTDDFMVAINGEPWQVVECWTGEDGRYVLLQKGREYLLYLRSLSAMDAFLWVTFAADATHLRSNPPPGYTTFPLVDAQRARARCELLALWE